MPFYHSQLKYVLDERGLSKEEIKSSLKISSKKFDLFINGEKTPNLNQINNLAEYLAVPPFAFYAKNFRIREPEIIDFRSKNINRYKFGKNSKWISKYISYFKLLAELSSRLEIQPKTNLPNISPEENPEQVAPAIRAALNLGKKQAEAKSTLEFMREFRDSIESSGIFVLQGHYLSKDIDGFSLNDEETGFQLIFVNSSKRSYGARVFTLAHELAHALGKRSAISNNYEADNEVEAFCNQFAAALLLPKEDVLNYCQVKRLEFGNYHQSIKSAKKTSAFFKTSISATLIRFKQLGITDQNYFYEFYKGFGEKGFLDGNAGGGGPGYEPGLAERALLGNRGVAIIDYALKKGVTSELEIYDRTGLSKSRVDGLRKLVEKEGINL